MFYWTVMIHIPIVYLLILKLFCLLLKLFSYSKFLPAWLHLVEKEPLVNSIHWLYHIRYLVWVNQYFLNTLYKTIHFKSHAKQHAGVVDYIVGLFIMVAIKWLYRQMYKAQLILVCLLIHLLYSVLPSIEIILMYLTFQWRNYEN